MLKENKNNSFKISEKTIMSLFLVPSVLGCLIFIFAPSLFSFLLSFTEWDLIGEIKFAGFDNYSELLSSYDFWLIFKNTIWYAFCVTIFSVLIPLILAAILNSEIKGKEFFKTAYFIPFITPMIVIAMIWQWIFDPNIGFVNSLFKLNIKWLYDTNFAMFVLILVSVWKLIGYNTVIFLSAFSALNTQIFEAANIDGAGKTRTFFHITVPLLTPTIFFVVLITTISSFQVFDLIYLMTNGGPENSTNVLVYWLYSNAFELFDIGKASAIAYILFIFIFILTIIQWKLRTKWVLNEKED